MTAGTSTNPATKRWGSFLTPTACYIANNLKFALDREPTNPRAGALLAQVEQQDPHAARLTTLGEEKEVNTFFRLSNPTVIARLREAFPDLPDQPSPKDVFLRLRELRDSW